MNENLHNATDLQIARLEGVAVALIELAHASDYLSGNSREAKAINALLLIMQDGVADVAAAHSAEWAGRHQNAA